LRRPLTHSSLAIQVFPPEAMESCFLASPPFIPDGPHSSFLFRNSYQTLDCSDSVPRRNARSSAPFPSDSGGSLQKVLPRLLIPCKPAHRASIRGDFPLVRLNDDKETSYQALFNAWLSRVASIARIDLFLFRWDERPEGLPCPPPPMPLNFSATPPPNLFRRTLAKPDSSLPYLTPASCNSLPFPFCNIYDSSSISTPLFFSVDDDSLVSRFLKPAALSLLPPLPIDL